MPTSRVPALAASAFAVLIALAPASAQDVARSGTFADAGGHAAAGGVELVEEGGAYTVVLGPDFSMDDAPDAYLAFGSADAWAEGTDFAMLEGAGGAQSYAVPDGIDPSAYDAVWLWCREFAVPLGVATLE